MYPKSFLKILKYFGHNQYHKFIIYFFLALIAGGLEFLGIALIYPFITMIVNPDSISNYLIYFPDFLKKLNNINLALVVGLASMLIFVLKNIYMMGYLYLQSHFLQKWTQSINNTIMEFFLFAPYRKTQQLSDSDKFYALNLLATQVTNGFVMRLLTLCTNSIIVLFVIGLILYKFPTAGLVTGGFVFVSIIFQNKIFRTKIDDLRNRLAIVTKKMTNITYPILRCIKDVKIFNAELQFLNKYKKCGNEYMKLIATQVFMESISPYIVETLIVLSLIILATVISFSNKGQEYVLVASFAIIVAAIFRIAPALNRIQTSINNLPATVNFANELISFYEKFELGNFNYDRTLSIQNNLPFNHAIKLEKITFSYNGEQNILEDVSLTINKNDFIGIIGLSGAGKTTLADIITGLLPITHGKILVDGIEVNQNNFSAFRQNIGYVQQELPVLECRFRENVAWGISPDKINDELVTKLLKDVKLWDVVKTYQNGIYSTPFIGENGLSRGQKQRLSIARALYRNPSILIFDEATSALDVKTEYDISTMLQNIAHDRTIIVIAHRLSTLKACTKLVYLKNGKLAAEGTFKELSAQYPDFAELVKLSGFEDENSDKI